MKKKLTVTESLFGDDPQSALRVIKALVLNNGGIVHLDKATAIRARDGYDLVHHVDERDEYVLKLIERK